MVALHVLVAALALSASGDTVLLEFSSDGCMPCRQMEPVVRQLAAQGLPVRQVNVGRDPALAQRFNVEGVPCFVMIADGREVDRVVGATSPDRLLAMFQQAGVTIPSVAGANLGNRGPATGPQTFRGQSPDQQPPSGFPAIRRAHVEGPQVPGPVAPASQPAVTPATVAPPAQAEFTPEQLAPRLLAATVRLRINDGDSNSVGSGTIVDSREGEALIVTCGHVFRESKGQGAIVVDLFGPGAPQGLPGTLVSYDLESDVGLLSIRPGVPVIAARLAATTFKARTGDRVMTVGCSHGDDATVVASKVTTIDKFLGPPNLQVAGLPVQGRSGGGVFNMRGELIGVCNAANPMDDEGLYAALASVYDELDEQGLTAMLTDQAAPPMPSNMPAAAVAGGPTEMPAVAAAAITGQEAKLLEKLRHQPDGAEVICIVRSKAHPYAASEVFVLDRVSPALMEQLAAARAEQARRAAATAQAVDPNTRVR